MGAADQRKLMRTILSGTDCVSPARVYDPLSACAAARAGYTFGLLAGSAAANVVLAAPDGLVLLTLTEFADLARLIVRASNLSLLVDADHGYGNALNVMRTVQELEHAGVAAISIEDAALPRHFDQPEGKDELISVEEMVGKLKAAVAARKDPALVIAGRTSALKIEGTERAVARAKAYAATGIDTLFIQKPESVEQLAAIYEATKLPIIIGSKAPGVSTRQSLAESGVRVWLPGHQPMAAAVKALRDTYTHLYSGGTPAALKATTASEEDMAALVRNDDYRAWQGAYLR